MIAFITLFQAYTHILIYIYLLGIMTEKVASIFAKIEEMQIMIRSEYILRDDIEFFADPTPPHASILRSQEPFTVRSQIDTDQVGLVVAFAQFIRQCWRYTLSVESPRSIVIYHKEGIVGSSKGHGSGRLFESFEYFVECFGSLPIQGIVFEGYKISISCSQGAIGGSG